VPVIFSFNVIDLKVEQYYQFHLSRLLGIKFLYKEILEVIIV